MFCVFGVRVVISMCVLCFEINALEYFINYFRVAKGRTNQLNNFVTVKYV